MKGYGLIQALMIAVACLCVVLPLIRMPRPLPTKTQLLVLLTLLALPISAYTFYQNWGVVGADLAYYLEPEQQAQRQKHQAIRPLMALAQKRIYKLRQHLSDKPDDILAWCDLGRLYSATHEYPHALQAWHNARQLKPQHLGLLSEINANYQLAREKIIERQALQP